MLAKLPGPDPSSPGRRRFPVATSVPPLALLAGNEISEREFQSLRHKYWMDPSLIRAIDRSRWERRVRKTEPIHSNLLREIRRPPEDRLLHRSVLLYRLHEYYAQPFHEVRVPLPPAPSESTQGLILLELLENPSVKVHSMEIEFRRKWRFVLYFLRTPPFRRPPSSTTATMTTTPVANYPPNTYMRITTYRQEIVDVEELESPW